MRWRISIRNGAERDLVKAWRWYEDQRLGLGDKFIATVGAAVVDLQTAADRQREYYRGFRSAAPPQPSSAKNAKRR